MRAVVAVDGWIFRTYEPCAKGLPYFRILFSIYLLVFYLPRYAWLARVPDFFFHPPISPVMFFAGLPPGWFFYALDFLLEFGALCLLVGRQTHFVSFAMCAGLVIGNSFRYSIGPKIDHDILTPATLFCLGFSGWGNRISQDELRLPRMARRSSSSWPIALLMLMVGFCMFTAAYPKVLTGWADPHVYACRAQIILNIILYDRPSRFADFLLQIQSPFFWKSADWSTLAFEGGFLFCVFSLPAMRFIVTLAVFFHIFVYFFMDLFFLSNLLAYACLLDLRLLLRKCWMRRLARRLHLFLHRIKLFHLAVLAVAFLVIDHRTAYFRKDFLLLSDSVAIILALVVAVGTLGHFFSVQLDRLVSGRGISSKNRPLSRHS